MLTRSRRPWSCPSIFRRQVSKSPICAAAALAGSAPGHRCSSTATRCEADDETLRQVFDSSSFWRDFSQSSRSWRKLRGPGLLHNHFLDRPAGFLDFAEASLARCRALEAKILAANSFEEFCGLAKDLDRLSDLLCRVIDVADFVRSVHSDADFQHAATEVHQRMFRYMNTLNTTTGLNDQLKRALEDDAVVRSWSPEELKVAQMLRKDFAQSAIDLPAAKRRQFVDLSTKVNLMGSQYLENMRPAQMSLPFSAQDLQGVNQDTWRPFRRRDSVWMPTFGTPLVQILRNATNEDIRRKAYVASRTAAQDQVDLLEKYLRAKSDLATLAGYSSFATMTLGDKMARTPAAVVTFLESMAENIQPGLLAQVERLKSLKASHVKQSTTEISAWDREFYRHQIQSLQSAPGPALADLRPFFSLGTAMQGLSRLFHRLYGIRLVPRETGPGETWAPEVRRLDVMDDEEGHIAVIYCDLFSRVGKNPIAAHYTLRCSRRIDAAEIADYATQAAPQALSHDEAIAFANDGMATSKPRADGSVDQLPILALTCDFQLDNSSTSPYLLSFSALSTLFHEMGHALHTILGRTQLQNVSGTRCATDFSELPSVLMESFATDPAVLQLFARHYKTGAPLPDAALDALPRRDRNDQLPDIEWQILLSLLDQAFHSAAPSDPHFSSDAIFQDIYARYGSVPEPRETRWQGFFGHLVGYGATYYAYLFDRAIAARVWDVVFGGGGRDGHALDRARGERFRNDVLRWGGSRDPWRCVADVLQDPDLEMGGERAMAKVGRWGVSRTSVDMGS